MLHSVVTPEASTDPPVVTQRTKVAQRAVPWSTAPSSCHTIGQMRGPEIWRKTGTSMREGALGLHFRPDQRSTRGATG